MTETDQKLLNDPKIFVKPNFFEKVSKWSNSKSYHVRSEIWRPSTSPSVSHPRLSHFSAENSKKSKISNIFQATLWGYMAMKPSGNHQNKVVWPLKGPESLFYSLLGHKWSDRFWPFHGKISNLMRISCVQNGNARWLVWSWLIRTSWFGWFF